MSDSNNQQAPNRSPTGLRGVTKAPQRGENVRRVNRVPLIAGLAVLGVLLLTILWTVHVKSSHPSGTASEATVSLTPSSVPENTFIHPKPKTIVGLVPDGSGATGQNGQGQQQAGQPGGAPSGPPGPPVAPFNPYQQQWVKYETDLAQLHSDKFDALKSALRQETGAATSSGASHGSSGGQGGSQGGGQGNQDAKGDSDYLSNGRTAALARYEVKAGTVIPGTLITGINSDVAGQIIGQVREAVFDSATGDKILIPQGSKLIGTYSSHISYGQDRIQIAWDRIIFPDQSSIDLPKMPGADMTGESGFEDQVNNHLVKIFGNALLASAFGAGVQLSQPTGNNSNGGYSAQQVISGQLGLQLGEVGQEFARRGLDIPPTIVIRPGYMFNIMVTKDMILPPYQDVYGNGDTHSVASNQ